MKAYDDAAAGAYFVTVCIHGRVHWFGEIRDGKMELNEAGRIAARQWIGLQEHYDCMTIDEFCVMSNHFHGILSIAGNGRDCSLLFD